MIDTNILRDTKFGTQKSCAYFRDELFGRIGMITKALAHFAIQAASSKHVSSVAFDAWVPTLFCC